MKLFVFKPSESWRYCGGGLVVIAESFERVKEMNPAEGEGIYRYESEVDKDKACPGWVLVDSFHVAGESERVVLYGYNWA